MSGRRIQLGIHFLAMKSSSSCFATTALSSLIDNDGNDVVVIIIRIIDQRVSILIFVPVIGLVAPKVDRTAEWLSVVVMLEDWVGIGRYRRDFPKMKSKMRRKIRTQY